MISKKEVQHIAKLARLGLTDEEQEKMQTELSSILDYFKLLDELDVSQVAPVFYPIPLKNVIREDIVEKKDNKEADRLVSQAPSKKERFIKVKKIY